MEYWKKLNPDGTISTVESHSYPHKVPGAVQITKEEYDKYITSMPEPELPEPEPSRDYGAEIDKIEAKIADYDTLKARVEKLEKK